MTRKLTKHSDSSSQSDLSGSGLNNFLEAIRQQTPNLSDDDRSELADSLLNEIGDRLKNDESIAFVKNTPDGKVNLHILSLKSASKRK